MRLNESESNRAKREMCTRLLRTTTRKDLPVRRAISSLRAAAEVEAESMVLKILDGGEESKRGEEA